MKKKKIRVEDSIGKVLSHDITGIIPGEFKGPLFKKGHIIQETDIEKFAKLGKEHIWILDIAKNEFHENEAGEKFKSLAGSNIITTGPSEGKVIFIAEKDGLLTVDKKLVNKINSVSDILFTTRHNFIPVKKGEEIAGIRIIPLATKKRNINKVLRIARKKKPLNVLTYKKKKVGLIITGNEVAKGLIKDKFRPVVEKKATRFGSIVSKVSILPDDKRKIASEILKMYDDCDFIILTGGMSVDPDDVTVDAIKSSGAKIVTHGAPVLPGNMFLLAYLNQTPIFGLPGASIFYEITVFDLFLPIVMADVKITKKDIIEKGYGGYCTHCKICTFPYCSFGKC